MGNIYISFDHGLGRSNMDSLTTINSDFFKNIIEYLKDGVAFLDSQNKFFFWNQGAVDITGFRYKISIPNTG